MHRYTYVLAHEREHCTQIYTRARTPSFAYIWTSANMCIHIHARCMLHKRVGRPSRYLSASLHYRTRGSSRKERAREGDGGGWKPFSVPGTTGPSAKNQCDHPSPEHLLSSSSADPPPIFLENTQSHQDRGTCTMWKRARGTARFTYQRISILIPWIQFTSWIAQVETTGETTKRRARYQPDRTNRGRSLFTGRRDGRTIASYVTWFPRTWC